jgi:hypothetical protein
VAGDELTGHVGECIYDTWHILDKLFGVVWPGHGMPCGTLVYGVV